MTGIWGNSAAQKKLQLATPHKMRTRPVLRACETSFACAVQVNSRTASAAAQSAAARLSKGKAALALELIGYDAELGAAMKYAFGNAFVCKARLLSRSETYWLLCAHAE